MARLVVLPPDVATFLANPAAKDILAPYVAVAEQAFVDATRAAGLVAAAFVLLGVVFSFLLPRTPPARGPEPVAPADADGG